MIAHHRPTVPGDEPGIALTTLAWLARAQAELDADLPGGAALVTEVAVALRAQRPPLRTLAGPTRALEAAAQVALGRPIAEVTDAPATADWLAALAAGEVTAAALVACAGGRIAAVPLVGWLGSAREIGAPTAPPGASQRGSRGGQERAGRAKDRVQRRTLNEAPKEESPLIHSFEKVHTLEKYKGGRKRIDGADDLAAHGDALDELELDEVVRSTTATSGVYRAELVGLDAAGELEEDAPAAIDAILYDEWDEGTHRYRTDWCQVRVERTPARATPEVTARFVRTARVRFQRERAALVSQISRLDDQPHRVGRQSDGPEIDVDAVVDRYGSLRGGTTGPEKLYVAYRRRPPDLAVTLLLDHSLSSDAWVANQRVLDVATGALVALGEALDHVRARTSILAFASHTRRDCRIAVIKNFDASWASAHARLASLEPSGYTRIGTALRHATAVLDREPARRKLLVLLSDGKPTDYDRYEGRYGVADVRRAVAEAATTGVHVFTVALDSRARHHLPQMFGPGGFAVVTRPRDLVQAIGRLYQQRLAT